MAGDFKRQEAELAKRMAAQPAEDADPERYMRRLHQDYPQLTQGRPSPWDLPW
jgi:hypothetical protein